MLVINRNAMQGLKLCTAFYYHSSLANAKPRVKASLYATSRYKHRCDGAYVEYLCSADSEICIDRNLYNGRPGGQSRQRGRSLRDICASGAGNPSARDSGRYPPHLRHHYNGGKLSGCRYRKGMAYNKHRPCKEW